MRDKDGRRRAVLSALADGPVGLTLIDKEGTAGAAFIMGEFAAVVLSDKAGTMRVKLGLAPDGSPFLLLSDGAGTGRVNLGVDAGGAGLALYDKDGKTRMRLVVDAGGSPGLTLFDAKGNVLWQAPR